MKTYRTRTFYTDQQKSEMWDRWQRGGAMGSIGRHFNRASSSIFPHLAQFGGIRPAARGPQEVAVCAELNGAGGDISRVGFRAVPAVNRSKSEPFGFNDQPRGSQKWWASGRSGDALGSPGLGLRHAAQIM